MVPEKTRNDILSDARLIVFTRYPEPGKTKTRLIPCLGPEGAAGLQRRMTEHLLSTVDRLASDEAVNVEVRYAGGSGKLMKNWLGPGFTFIPQGRGALDRRMGSAFAAAFNSGARRVIIIGTDIPDISTGILIRAFDSLKHSDLVFGPAADGGYYLIGMHAGSFRRALPALFTGIDWGSATVLNRSLKIAESCGLTVKLLEELQDVDRPEDLAAWNQITDQGKKNYITKRITVIIPTLNEAANIGRTLDHLRPTQNVEVIVVDGGSADDTVEQAESCGAKVIRARRGRACQMNAGAAGATGDVLLFLHADTCLPPGFEGHIHHILENPGVVAGAFELVIDSPIHSLRIVERVANWRARLLQAPYGDQAIFVPVARFREIGGYLPLPIMEDFAFVRQLRKKGRIAILPVPVVTSPRRWLNVGVWKTLVVNQLIITGYWLGIPPEKLARWYKREKGIR